MLKSDFIFEKKIQIKSNFFKVVIIAFFYSNINKLF